MDCKRFLAATAVAAAAVALPLVGALPASAHTLGAQHALHVLHSNPHSAQRQHNQWSVAHNDPFVSVIPSEVEAVDNGEVAFVVTGRGFTPGQAVIITIPGSGLPGAAALTDFRGNFIASISGFAASEGVFPVVVTDGIPGEVGSSVVDIS